MNNEYSEQLANPTIESALKDWREQGGLTRLEGTKCDMCQNIYFPRRAVCPECHSIEVSPVKFSGYGTLINIEKNDIPQIAIFGYREKIPRFLAVIRLTEGPYVLGEIIESNVRLEDSLLNKTVKMVVRKQSRSANTTWKYGYKFELISNMEVE